MCFFDSGTARNIVGRVALTFMALIVLGFSAPVYGQTCPVGYTRTSINFQFDDQGNPLSAGDVFDAMTQHYTMLGLTFELALNPSSTCTGPLMIFDTGNPTGGDLDLGSPNQTCPGGGPGVGTGGEFGDFYENCDPLGNVLIISEDGDSTDPDDCASQTNIIRIRFAYATTLFEVTTLDVDSSIDRPTVLLYDAADMLLGSRLLGSGPGHDPTQLGDNSKVTQVGLDDIGPQMVRRFDFEFPGSGSLSGFDYCRENSFVPVTLSAFTASQWDGGGRFRWSTATEVGTVGFHLYAETGGERRRVNPEMIPSKAVDSVEPLDYSFELLGVTGEQFYLAEVDIYGNESLYGPFLSGKTYGGVVPAAPIDWEAVGIETAAKKASRPARSGSLAQAAPGGFLHRTLTPKKPSAMNLRVSRNGLYRVTYEDLAAAGWELQGVKAKRLALANRGHPVPIYLNAGKTFGPDSYFEFYGEAIDTLYTRENVYCLSLDPQQGLRVAEDSRLPRPDATPPVAYTETVEVERNRAYSFAAPNGDPWYDTSMRADMAPSGYSFEVSIDQLVSGHGGERIGVQMWGGIDWPAAPDHHVEVAFNGVPLADEFFDGLVDHPVELELPAGLLQEGVNTLDLTLLGDTGVQTDLVSLDSFWVRHQRGFVARNGQLEFKSSATVFRVDGFSSPEVIVYRVHGGDLVRLSGARSERTSAGYAVVFPGLDQPADYVVAEATEVLSPAFEILYQTPHLPRGKADYLILSHPDFLAELEPLVEARQEQGWRVAVVNIQDIYQHFNYGIVDPEAIHRFLAQEAEGLGTQLLLLVGGDTYDYHDHLGTGSISFIPTPYRATDAIVRFTPSDPIYGDLDQDGSPELAVGRFPVRTSQELAHLIQKTLDYEAKRYSREGVFAADGFDGAQSFSALSDNFIQQLPSGWNVARAYLDELDPAEAQELLIDSMDAGAALTVFFGHSGPTVWTFDGLFNSQLARELQNLSRPTIAVQWGCWNSYFVSPALDSLGQELLVGGLNGAAAVMGATTLTQTASDVALGELLIPRMVEPGETIGLALRDAKRELSRTHPEMLDVLLGWTILGDPALVVDY